MFVKLIDWLLNLIERLFNKHKLVRRSIIAFVLVLIGWATLHTFPKLQGDLLLKAYLAVLGIITPILGFYKWLRSKEDKWEE